MSINALMRRGGQDADERTIIQRFRIALYINNKITPTTSIKIYWCLKKIKGYSTKSV